MCLYFLLRRNSKNSSQFIRSTSRAFPHQSDEIETNRSSRPFSEISLRRGVSLKCTFSFDKIQIRINALPSQSCNWIPSPLEESPLSPGGAVYRVGDSGLCSTHPVVNSASGVARQALCPRDCRWADNGRQFAAEVVFPTARPQETPWAGAGGAWTTSDGRHNGSTIWRPRPPSVTSLAGWPNERDARSALLTYSSRAGRCQCCGVEWGLDLGWFPKIASFPHSKTALNEKFDSKD